MTLSLIQKRKNPLHQTRIIQKRILKRNIINSDTNIENNLASFDFITNMENQLLRTELPPESDTSTLESFSEFSTVVNMQND